VALHLCGCPLGLLVAGVAAAATLPVVAQSRIDVQRSVYVTAVDQSGAGVPDLTAADLTVKEGGERREVLRVERARGRLKIALAVEELLTPYNVVRQALGGFIDRVQGAADIALYVVGRRNEKRVDYTADIMPLVTAINAFPPHATGDGILVEALLEIAQEQRLLEGRRVIVVVATETVQISSVTAASVLAQIRDARGVLYAATLKGAEVAAPPPDATSGGRRLSLESQATGLERDKVLGDGTRQSGGLRVSSVRIDGFPAALHRIANDLGYQYVVTYRLPAGSKSSGEVSVAANRKGLTVRGPTRVPDLSSYER
jgi:VWFA-related protein